MRLLHESDRDDIVFLLAGARQGLATYWTGAGAAVTVLLTC